ncbi:Uncharacterized protein YuzB, UPF0349 family [Clostridium cavendishii DSM 21758]|uniref:Uncharacterized protein YuzB, UPF0349 family n=1 Tax=Clostridium cavendishii DSM 21758 TaxID=1121302 RepID=A0A1M6JFI4_9CLOT|nr:DUF1450 domain-containing protein [Clostridium cavendishii]SHJ45443.1 Uncharacterized protein YuzB, UPF0349 family [Clostridium cavendishii DSM 21758]
MTEIKFCENNFSFGTEETMKKLKENFNNVDVSAESCLGYCGDCSVGPYALVNGEIIQANTAEELFEKIRDMI